jgi:hypothetical protein
MLLVGAVRRALPLIGKAQAQRKILDNLTAVFNEVGPGCGWGGVSAATAGWFVQRRLCTC